MQQSLRIRGTEAPARGVQASHRPRTNAVLRPAGRQAAHTVVASARMAVVLVEASAVRTLHNPSFTSFSGRGVVALPAASSAHARLRCKPRPRGSVRSRASAVAVQANLFDRLFRVVKAYINQVLGTFEDPERLLDRLVDEMTEDAMRMKQASAQAIAAQRQMQSRTANAQAAADQWLRRAELAVAKGQDDLAREALTRRKALQADADKLAAQAKAQTQAVDQLTASVRMLDGKINEAKSKKETLKARAASAKTSIAIQEMIGSLRSTSTSSFAVFDKMEEKVMALEAEAQGAAALATPDALEARFAMLEGGNDVEDELRVLKSGRAAATLPRPRVEDYLSNSNIGAATRSQVELELEELRRQVRA